MRQDRTLVNTDVIRRPCVFSFGEGASIRNGAVISSNFTQKRRRRNNVISRDAAFVPAQICKSVFPRVFLVTCSCTKRERIQHGGESVFMWTHFDAFWRESYDKDAILNITCVFLNALYLVWWDLGAGKRSAVAAKPCSTQLTDIPG